jgi:hypothetical protein
VTAGPRRIFPLALVVLVAVAVVGVVAAAGLASRPAAPTNEPVDLASLASYPPVPEATANTSVTLTGAGDIASCELTNDEATAALLEDLPGYVFTAGDNAYESGTAAEFDNCYDPAGGSSASGRFRRSATTTSRRPGRRATTTISARVPEIRELGGTRSISGRGD